MEVAVEARPLRAEKKTAGVTFIFRKAHPIFSRGCRSAVALEPVEARRLAERVGWILERKA